MTRDAEKRILVRAAKLSDYQDVERLWLQQNAYHARLEPAHMNTVDVYQEREEFEGIVADPAREIALVDRGGQILAAALLVERHYLGGGVALPKSVAFVQEICVEEGARRRGLGRLLMGYIERWARKRRLGSIELNVWAKNSEALAFYYSLGFVELRYELTKPVDQAQ